MRDFSIAVNLAIVEAHQYPIAQVMPMELRIYQAEPDPLVSILFQPSSETTWGNLDCFISGLKRFMRRW